MLKKIARWLGIFAGSIVILMLLFYAVVYWKTRERANKQYDVSIQHLKIPTDSASLALGAHVAAVRGCPNCHAGGGTPFFDDKNPVVLLHASNLTSGTGGIQYTDADWIRALRHGVGKDGKSLWFMPAQHTSAGLSNKEMAALIAYLKQLAPVNQLHPTKQLRPLGRLLTFFGQFPMFTAEAINHQAVFPDEVKVAPTAAYGRYLAVGCQGCHGPAYKGAPGHGKGEPPAPDISSTGKAGSWSSQQLIATLRTGRTPDGRVLSAFMPWQAIGSADTEDELTALYLYLHAAK